MPLLEINDLSISFGGLVAIDSLSFSVEEGQIYGLIGPNGAGKSTVFNCITRYYTPQRGEIIYDCKNLLNLKPSQIITCGLARTFQNMELFSSMTVLDNLLVGQHSHLKTNVFSEAFMTRSQKQKERLSREKVFAVIEELGLQDYVKSNVKALPYGIQKLVELGRALVTEPKMILLDEPAAGMNQGETEELTRLIRNLRDEKEITILLVEHDMSLVRSICEEITVIDFGRKIAQGTADQVCNDPKVIEAYLGNQEV